MYVGRFNLLDGGVTTGGGGGGRAGTGGDVPPPPPIGWQKKSDSRVIKLLLKST